MVKHAIASVVHLDTWASFARGLFPSAPAAPGATSNMPSVFFATSISAKRDTHASDSAGVYRVALTSFAVEV